MTREMPANQSNGGAFNYAKMSTAKSATNREYKPVYVVSGKDKALCNGQCSRLLDRLLEPDQRISCLFKVDGAGASVSRVLDELRTLPFLADRRVVLIKDADKFVSDNRQVLERYFDNPCSSGTLILVVTSWPANTKLAKKLPKVGKLINIVAPKPWQLPDRLINYSKEAHNKRLDRQAAELLVELAGDELTTLYNEIDKLALFADREKAITQKHIESLIGHNRLFNSFAVIDSVLAGDIVKAVGRLRKMFEADRAAEFTFIGAFAFHFRRMFNAKVLVEGGQSTIDVAKRLRIWGDRNAFFAQLKKVSLEQIGRNMQQLAETDYAIKTGRVKPKVAAEQLVFKLAAGTE